MDHINKLSDFGYTFQTKVIASLITDKQFFVQVIDILDVTFFDNEATQIILKGIKDFYKKYHSIPTMDAIILYIKKNGSDVLRVAAQQVLSDAYKAMEASDLQSVKDETEEFCVNQTMKQALLTSVDLLETGQYGAIKKLIEEAMKVTIEKRIGHDYIKDIEDRYKNNTRSAVSTGWDSIDKIIQGGLGKGELGVIMAPSGGGKSWMLQYLGNNALKEGKNVLFYTLELSEEYTGRRFDTINTGIPADELSTNKHKVLSSIENLPGKLMIRYFAPRKTTLAQLSAHYEQSLNVGFKPDLIIVDYADKIRPDSYGRRVERKDEELGNIYEDLRTMSNEYSVPCWTATQTKREGTTMEVIEANSIAEGYSKVMVSDLIISMSRMTRDKVYNTARFHIVKNRLGTDGRTYKGIVDTDKGHIEILDELIDDSSTKERKQRKELLDSGELMNKVKNSIRNKTKNKF